MKIQDAVSKLREELKNDEGFYIGYQSNIAMAFYDEAIKQGIVNDKLLEISNNAANHFLKRLIRGEEEELMENENLLKELKELKEKFAKLEKDWKEPYTVWQVPYTVSGGWTYHE